MNTDLTKEDIKELADRYKKASFSTCPEPGLFYGVCGECGRVAEGSAVCECLKRKALALGKLEQLKQETFSNGERIVLVCRKCTKFERAAGLATSNDISDLLIKGWVVEPTGRCVCPKCSGSGPGGKGTLEAEIHDGGVETKWH